MDYTALITEQDNLHIGTVPDLPGCVAIAPTYFETRMRLIQAIRIHSDRIAAQGNAEQPKVKSCTISLKSA